MNAAAHHPAPDEYAAYYGRYINLVPEGNIVRTLERQVGETAGLLRGIGPQRADFRYAPDKWTLRQSVLHVLDTERVMAYRALRFSRGDTTPVPGFEQDVFAALAPAEAHTLAELAGALERLRASNLDLFRTFDEAALLRRGEASGNPVSVRALLWIIAGHELHHVKLIRERYLV